MTTPGQLMNRVSLCRGQTKVLKVTIKDQNGACANLSSATLYFTVRESVETDVLLCLASPDDGIEITDAAKGLATITISSDDSDIEPGRYKYDLWVEYAGTPPIRHPVVRNAEFCIENCVFTPCS